jgi:hypothetical protein
MTASAENDVKPIEVAGGGSMRITAANEGGRTITYNFKLTGAESDGPDSNNEFNARVDNAITREDVDTNGKLKEIGLLANKLVRTVDVLRSNGAITKLIQSHKRKIMLLNNSPETVLKPEEARDLHNVGALGLTTDIEETSWKTEEASSRLMIGEMQTDLMKLGVTEVIVKFGHENLVSADFRGEK